MLEIFNCSHDYKYIGIVWSVEDLPEYNSQMSTMLYEDKFYCTKCLDTVYKNRRIHGTVVSVPPAGCFKK